MNATVNHALPYVGERGNYLCLAQKHTRNTSCTRSTAFARPSYTLRLSTHGVIGAGGGRNIAATLAKFSLAALKVLRESHTGETATF